MEDLNITKIGSLVVLFFLSLLFGLLPLKIRKWRNQMNLIGSQNSFYHGSHFSAKLQLTVNLLMAFGGGVLISTCFLHMMPEVRQQLYDLSISNYPICELIICGGFFFVYTLEEVIDYFIREKALEDSVTETESSDTESWVFKKKPKASSDAAWYGAIENRGEHSNNHHFAGSHQHYNPFTNTVSPNAECSKRPTEDVNETGKIARKISCVQPANAFEGYSTLPSDTADCKPVSTKSSFRGLIIVIALSLHSIIEGMAVGLQQTDNDVWTLLFAITVHKIVIVFTIGTQLVCSNLNTKTIIIYMTVLSLMSPIGILSGTIVANSNLGTATQEGVVVGVCQGVAAGTLLYVTFFEILANVRQSDTNGLVKLVMVMAGFGLMAAITIMNAHVHIQIDKSLKLKRIL